MSFRSHALSLALLLSAMCPAQKNVPVNGPADKSQVVAFTHATVHASPGRTITDGTVLVRYGRIIRMEQYGTPPPGAVVYDLHGGATRLRALEH